MEVARDMELVKEKGLTIDRFPRSFSDTYLTIAKKMKIDTRRAEDEAKQAYKIGEEVFNQNSWGKELIPHARQTLDFLVAQKDELYLLTAGDESLQRKKIGFYNLPNWFGDKTFVTPNHKKEKILEISSSRDKKNVWFVGNSIRSDINPALESGIGAVYIPFESWEFDQGKLDENHNRLVTLENIRDFPKIYFSKLS
jgi:putative hydrolase of the HAD superfamily